MKDESYYPVTFAHSDKRELIKKMETCQFCGSKLHFTYIQNHIRQIILEKAACPECGIKLREREHPVQ